MYCTVLSIIRFFSRFQIRSYGIAICLFSINAHILPPVHCQAFSGDFIKLLLSDEYLGANREEAMLFHLQLLFHATTEAKRRKELSSTRLPSSVYLWLARRISHSEKSHRYKKYLLLSRDTEFLRETKVCPHIKDHY